MKRFFFLLLGFALVVAGCSRKAPKAETVSSTSNETNTPEGTPAEAAQTGAENPDPSAAAAPDVPLPPPPPPSRVVTARAENALHQNVVGEVDGTLTAELRNFIQQKKRMPQTFSEFAGIRLDSVPRPPEGKKWVIDTETLEVKAVAAK